MIKKTAVIIGASSDIGVEVAKLFSKKGYNLALTYNSNELNFEKLIEKNENEIKSYKLDLTKNLSIKSFFENLTQDFKTFDCLVFVAGVAQKRQLIMDVTDKEIETLFNVNSIAPIKCIREFCKLTVNKNPASIVLTGSFVEKNGCSCESVYTATKSALTGLCKSLASELGNLDIRINVIAPGFIDTKMNNNLTNEEKDEIANMTPLKRLGTAEDVSKAIEFLASDASSYITGQTLAIDGGLVLE